MDLLLGLVLILIGAGWPQLVALVASDVGWRPPGSARRLMAALLAPVVWIPFVWWRFNEAAEAMTAEGRYVCSMHGWLAVFAVYGGALVHLTLAVAVQRAMFLLTRWRQGAIA